MCVSHRGRFRKVGDYIVYEVAGFRFFMILGKDMIVRSFHNVCRHRAFPVARKQSGSALVLGCRYHGWSYDTKGTLVKAPYFDNLPGFDKSQNSLFKIHTKEDGNGFLHINVSAREDVATTTPPEATRSGELGQIKLESHLIDTMEFKGRFNWKVIRKFFLSNLTKAASDTMYSITKQSTINRENLRQKFQLRTLWEPYYPKARILLERWAFSL